MKKRPTKKSFYEYMSERFNRKYRDSEGYDSLLEFIQEAKDETCLLYTSPSPRDVEESRMPSSA